MRAFLGATLTVEAPGDLRPRLRRAATFRRKGRLPKGEGRQVRWYRDGLGARPALDVLWLPRGLCGALRTMAPSAQVADRRLRRPTVDFRWRGRLDRRQAETVQRAVRNGSGMVIAPPGAGKTVIGLGIVAQLRQPAVWLTHTLPLAEYAEAEARKFFDLPRGAIGVVADGHGRAHSHLTVAMVQTLAGQRRLLRRLAAHAGCVISDEAHHTGALRTFASVVSAFPAWARLGLTASPDREDGLTPLVDAILGPERYEITMADTVAAGRNLLPWVRMVPTAFVHHGARTWQAMQSARAADGPRNAIVCGLAAGEFRAGRRLVILVELLAHAERLRWLLSTRWRTPALVVVGDTPAPERRRGIALLEAGRAVLIATKLLDEGVNVPAMDRLILAASGKSRIRGIQQTGRVMRATSGKPNAVVYDLCDVREPALREQARIRRDLYRERGFRLAAGASPRRDSKE